MGTLYRMLRSTVLCSCASPAYVGSRMSTRPGRTESDGRRRYAERCAGTRIRWRSSWRTATDYGHTRSSASPPRSWDSIQTPISSTRTRTRSTTLTGARPRGFKPDWDPLLLLGQLLGSPLRVPTKWAVERRWIPRPVRRRRGSRPLSAPPVGCSGDPRKTHKARALDHSRANLPSLQPKRPPRNPNDTAARTSGRASSSECAR